MTQRPEHTNEKVRAGRDETEGARSPRPVGGGGRGVDGTGGLADAGPRGPSVGGGGGGGRQGVYLGALLVGVGL